MIEFPPLPDKEFFSIGEASKIVQVPAYVLRYWESEFKSLRPARRGSGQRKYIRRDIEQLLTIKDLLYNKKFTIPGARKHLQGDRKRKEQQPYQLNMDIIGGEAGCPEDAEVRKVLLEAKRELEDILNILR